MTVIGVVTDPEACTVTLSAEYHATPERVWRMWADPRLLERWWGPPTYPATVVAHDLAVDGRVSYVMTGPEGDRHHGWWRVLSVTPPTALRFEDGFADADDVPDPDLPTSITRVTIVPDGEWSRMTIETTVASPESMAQLMAMGMVEGITAAVGQIDALLTEQDAPNP